MASGSIHQLIEHLLKTQSIAIRSHLARKLIQGIKIGDCSFHGLVRQHSLPEPTPLLGLGYSLRIQLSKVTNLVFPCSQKSLAAFLPLPHIKSHVLQLSLNLLSLQTTSFTSVVGCNQTLVHTASIARLLELTDKQLPISSMKGLLQATEGKLILELEQFLLSISRWLKVDIINIPNSLSTRRRNQMAVPPSPLMCIFELLQVREAPLCGLGKLISQVRSSTVNISSRWGRVRCNIA